MKKTMFTAFIAVLITTISAKSADFNQAEQLLVLNQREDSAYIDLQNAEQDALMGKISSAELKAAQQKYDAIKAQLENELAKLPNRAEIEQWLIDNHIHAGTE
jgi:ABC-type oligopeptide transport system substrate-binding subunit